MGTSGTLLRGILHLTIWRFVCEFPDRDREFDTLPDDQLSALGFFCDGHEEWMEESCAEQRARDPKNLA